ncbi:MAG: pyridine nucleotide-disulfide oxidoreductase, partial [Pseudomonadota bacterium]
MNKLTLRLLIVAVIAALVVAYFAFDLGQFLSFDALKAQRDALHAKVAENPGPALGLFFIAYVLVAALSLPGAAIMTLAGGALFGLWRGTLAVSFASTIGATLAFLAARFLLR